jgi:hypothetical protein
MTDKGLETGKCQCCGREKPIFLLGECHECFNNNYKCISCSKPMDGSFDIMTVVGNAYGLRGARMMQCFECRGVGERTLRQINRR